MKTFSARVATLPRLGVGISGEFGSVTKGIDACQLHSADPELFHFYEYGSDVERGLDEHVRRWVASGWPCTYHFLDINIEERADLSAGWLAQTREMLAQLQAVWLCGDAGRWHFGNWERGHQMLMPPILCWESVKEAAANLQQIQTTLDYLCLPENPPGVIYLGEMHLLDYFAAVTTTADCGFLLDCAHLAIFQHSRNLSPLTGLDNFPLERIVEMHIAGGRLTNTQGFTYIEDDHSPEPLPAAWEILEYVIPRAPNLRAIVYECELNAPEECQETFWRLNQLFPVNQALPGSPNEGIAAVITSGVLAEEVG
jgi:uncharacterized protein